MIVTTRRALLFFSIAVLLGSSANVSAMSACERAMRSVYIVVKTALQGKQLALKDIQYMIDAPDVVGNPFDYKDRTTENLALRQELGKHLPRVKDESIAALKNQLRELMSTATQNETLVAEARRTTAVVIAPGEVDLDIPPNMDLKGRIATAWHTDKNGELQIAAFNVDTHQLMITGRKLSLLKDLSKTIGREKIESRIGQFSFLTLPDGNLVFAHLQPSGQRILIYDSTSDYAYAALLDKRASQVQLVRGKDDKTYAVLSSEKNITVDRIEPNYLAPHFSLDAESKWERLVTLPSSDGKVAFAALESKHLIRVIDPLAKMTRDYASKHPIFDFTGRILPNGETLLAVAASPLRRAGQCQYEFHRSDSDEVLRTGLYYFSDKPGELFITPEGGVLFALASNVLVGDDENTDAPHYSNEIDLFEPLNPPKRGLINRLMRRTPLLRPIGTLIPEALGYTQAGPKWLDPARGRVMIGVQMSRAQDVREKRVTLYEPGKQLTPIASVPVTAMTLSSPQVEFELIDVQGSNQVILKITEVIDKVTAFYDAGNSHKPLATYNLDPLAQMKPDKYGDIYIYGSQTQVRNGVSTRTLHLYRLTTGGREAAGL